MLCAVDARRPQHAGEHRRACEDVERQIAIVIVIAVELRQLLVAVQGHVGGVDSRSRINRSFLLCRNELFDQHAVQGHDIGARRARLQAREGRAAGQFLDSAHGGLHQGIVAQPVVIVQILVAAAQAVQALGDQIA